MALLAIAICSDFVEKTRKHFFLAVFVVVLFGVIFCFSRIVKLTRGVFFVVTVRRHNKLYFPLKFYLYNVFTSEQDEFLEKAR